MYAEPNTIEEGGTRQTDRQRHKTALLPSLPPSFSYSPPVLSGRVRPSICPKGSTGRKEGREEGEGDARARGEGLFNLIQSSDGDGGGGANTRSQSRMLSE